MKKIFVDEWRDTGIFMTEDRVMGTGMYEQFIDFLHGSDKHYEKEDIQKCTFVVEDAYFEGIRDERVRRIGKSLYDHKYFYIALAHHLDKPVITARGTTYKNKIGKMYDIWVLKSTEKCEPVLFTFDKKVWYAISPIIETKTTVDAPNISEILYE